MHSVTQSFGDRNLKKYIKGQVAARCFKIMKIKIMTKKITIKAINSMI